MRLRYDSLQYEIVWLYIRLAVTCACMRRVFPVWLYQTFFQGTSVFWTDRCSDSGIHKICLFYLVSNTLSKTLFSQDKAKLDTGKTLIDIMLCKAVVLKELQRPIEANECYERYTFLFSTYHIVLPPNVCHFFLS